MSMQEVQVLGQATKNLTHSLGMSTESVRQDRADRQAKVEAGYKADTARRANKAEAEWDAEAENRARKRQLDLIETDNKVLANRVTDEWAKWAKDRPIDYYDPADADNAAAEFDTYMRETNPSIYNPRINRGVFHRGIADDLERKTMVMDTGKIISEQMVQSLSSGFVAANELFYSDTVTSPKTAAGPGVQQTPTNDSANQPQAVSNQVAALEGLSNSINPFMSRLDPDFAGGAFKFTVSKDLAKNGQPLIDVSHPNFIEALEQDGKRGNISTTTKRNMTMQEAQQYMANLVKRNGKHIPRAYEANQNERIKANIERQEKAPVYFSGTTGEFVSGFKSQDKNWDWKFSLTGDGSQPQAYNFLDEEDATVKLNLYKLTDQEHDHLKVRYADWYKNSGGNKPTKAVKRQWAEEIVAMRQASYKEKEKKGKGPKEHDGSDINRKATEMRSKERSMINDKNPDSQKFTYESELDMETMLSSALSEIEGVTPNKVNSVLRELNSSALHYSKGNEEAYMRTMDAYLQAAEAGVPIDDIVDEFIASPVTDDEPWIIKPRKEKQDKRKSYHRRLFERNWNRMFGKDKGEV